MNVHGVRADRYHALYARLGQIGMGFARLANEAAWQASFAFVRGNDAACAAHMARARLMSTLACRYLRASDRVDGWVLQAALKAQGIGDDGRTAAYALRRSHGHQ